MRHLTLIAALLLFSSAQAATYVYQASPYQDHQGRCGGTLLPFQMTITVTKAFPPNRKLNMTFQTVAIDAGGKYQWGYRSTKKHQLSGLFTTDANGDITEWSVGASKFARTQAWTHNETGSVGDVVEFKCGAAGTQNDPGTWTRTE
jgi:hypothetical protein